MSRVLVAGGSGLIGRPVVGRFLQEGWRVRILARHADDAAAEWPEGVEAWRASVTDAEAVRGAARGCDAVVHIVGIVRENPPEATFEGVNVEGTAHMLEEARRAGVQRFVFLSSLGAARGSSDYHRSKKSAEDLVRAFFGRWLILRPGNVYGPGDAVISRYLQMIRKLPAVPVLGDGDRQFQPIWADDLAAAIVRSVVRDEPAQQAVEVAGDDCVSMHDLLDMFEEITGRTPARIPVPEWIGKHGARAGEALGVDVPITDDQVTMMLEDNFILEEETNGLTEVLGVEPIPIEVGLVRLADTLPEQSPEGGTGTLFRNRYWVDIRDSRLDAEELFELFRSEFYDLAPKSLLEVGAEPGSSSVPEEGVSLTMAIPLRGTIQVRVVEIAERTLTCATIEGHFLSGVIRFFVEERSDPEPHLRFEVRSYARPTDLADWVAMRTFGRFAQKVTWESVVSAVLERSGGEALDDVRSESTSLKGDDAERVEAWAEEVVRRHRRKDAGGEE